MPEEVGEGSEWMAAPVDGGYRVTYDNQHICISVVVKDPTEIDAQRRLMLAALGILKGESPARGVHADVCLPPLMFK